MFRNLLQRFGFYSEAVVTLADAHYFPGLLTLYHSIQKSYPVPVVCYDIGLTSEQKALVTKRSHPRLYIEPIPTTSEIQLIKSTLDGGSLAKPGKREWPLWVCPFLIAACPFRRVFWLDCDLVVLRDLQGLFEMLDHGPVFTQENLAPEQTPNKPDLYELLPIDRKYDPRLPTLNGGVSGWDLVRDKSVLQAYMYPVLQACEDSNVRKAISWHDQGALIWAVQKNGLENRVTKDWKWNLCVVHSQAVNKQYDWNSPRLLEKLREDAPNANLLHWNGNPVPWGMNASFTQA